MTVIIMLNFTHHKDQFNILDPSSFHRLTKPTTKCNVNPIHPPLTDINASITNHSPSTTQPRPPDTHDQPQLTQIESKKTPQSKPHTNAKNSLTNQLTNNNQHHHQRSPDLRNTHQPQTHNQLLTYSRPP